MKRFLLLCFCLYFCGCAFALDFNTVKQKTLNTVSENTGIKVNSNSKQIEAEKEFYSELYSSESRLKLHYCLIQDDVGSYNKDGIESLYGDLLIYIKEHSSLYTINTQYAEKAKQLFDKINTFDTENSPKTAKFEKMKIIIPDNDFDKIDDFIKKTIYYLNVY